MKTTCTICGCAHYEFLSFKAGHVCEECLAYIKDNDADTSAESVINSDE